MKKLLVGCMLLGVPGLVALGNLAFAPEAEAHPGEACFTTYYSDETYSTVVGHYYCGCTFQGCTRNGQQTAYAETECWSC